MLEINKTTETKSLYERNIFIANFIKGKTNGNNLISALVETIEINYKNKNFKALKAINVELKAWIRLLPDHDIKELEKYYFNKFNIKLTGAEEIHKVITRVLKTKVIKDEDAFRVVQEYLNDNLKDDKYFGKRSELEMLLTEYLKIKS